MKMYVLDTSVLIHDPRSIYAFRGNIVNIPIYVVMELDVLKTGKDGRTAQAARQAIRYITKFIEEGTGSSVKNGVWGEEFEIMLHIGASWEDVKDVYQNAQNQVYMDGMILSAAIDASNKRGEEVILISKDANMRILAEGIGLHNQDYEKDKISAREFEQEEDIIYVSIDDVDTTLLAAIYSEQGVPYSGFSSVKTWNNQFLMVEAENKSYLLRRVDDRLYGISKKESIDRNVKARDYKQSAAIHLLMDEGVELVCLSGMSGTGKTFLALAAGIDQLMSGRYERIVLVKPVIPMGKDIGYLPGDFGEKMDPWMQSFYDNLDQLFNVQEGSPEREWMHLLHDGKIQIQALHSIRGRSLRNSFIITDEFQNTSSHEVKTLITRAAEGTKIVMCGDPAQIDNTFLDKLSNGLVYAIRRTVESELTGYVTLTNGVRSPLSEMAANLL